MYMNKNPHFFPDKRKKKENEKLKLNKKNKQNATVICQMGLNHDIDKIT